MPMNPNENYDNIIEHEIWTRSYLCAIDVASPRAAAATAEEAVALYRARWIKKYPAASESLVSDEVRYQNSLLGARLASSVRYRIR